MLNNNICHIVSKGISAGDKVFKYIPLYDYGKKLALGYKCTAGILRINIWCINISISTILKDYKTTNVYLQECSFRLSKLIPAH